MGHDHSSKNSRRDFLKIMGTSTGVALFRHPLKVLIESIVLGAASASQAQAAGLNPRRYLHILQEGAPPRWMYDLFLTPYDRAGFVSNAQLGTNYDFSVPGAALQYNTIARSGLMVPHMWQYEVASAAGGMRNIDSLLTNMLQIRGIQVGNPDHGAAQAMQFLPNGSVQSMTSLSADASPDKPIPAVNLSLEQYKFVSLQSKSAITVANSGNMLSNLLSPFVSTTSGTFLTNKQKLGTSLDAALQLMNAATEAQRPKAATISASNEAAKDLLSKGFGNLTTTWNSLVAKYNSLILRSMDPTRNLPGLNDAPIVPDGTKKFQVNSTIVQNPDLRTMITNSTQVYNLASHFAVAEYILVNNLSSSISIAPSTLYQFFMNGEVNYYLGADEHFTGGGVSTLLNVYLNLAISSCLIELIDQLKAKGIFNDTVIVMGGEFGRSARTDGFGSDHGYMGSSSVIYSGAIKAPMVLGNILNDASTSERGTWGQGAAVTQLGRALNISDWAATVASLLRVPSPTEVSSSLVIENATGIQALIERARQV